MLFVDFKVMVSHSTTTTLKVFLLLSEFSFDMLQCFIGSGLFSTTWVLRVMTSPMTSIMATTALPSGGSFLPYKELVLVGSGVVLTKFNIWTYTVQNWSKPKKACSINWWRWSEYHACCIKIFSAISSSSTCLNIETHTHRLHYQQLIPFGKLLIQLLQTSDGMWVVQYFCVIFVNIQSCIVDCFCKFTYKTLLHYSNHSVCSI